MNFCFIKPNHFVPREFCVPTWFATNWYLEIFLNNVYFSLSSIGATFVKCITNDFHVFISSQGTVKSSVAFSLIAASEFLKNGFQWTCRILPDIWGRRAFTMFFSFLPLQFLSSCVSANALDCLLSVHHRALLPQLFYLIILLSFVLMFSSVS